VIYRYGKSCAYRELYSARLTWYERLAANYFYRRRQGARTEGRIIRGMILKAIAFGLAVGAAVWIMPYVYAFGKLMRKW
jgi:hypothetical protein